MLTVTTLGGSNITRLIADSDKELNSIYLFYTLKSIRQTSIELSAQQLEAQLAEPRLPADAKARLEETIKRYRERIDRYESDPQVGAGKEELLASAKNFEDIGYRAKEKELSLSFAQALFQIAISIGSVSIVAASRVLAGISGIIAVFASLEMINGFFLLVHLPFW